ncbi:hypothetical protein D3C78_1556510 [compost metagenome]
MIVGNRFTCVKLVTNAAWTRQIRNIGRIDFVFLYGAILLLNSHIKFTRYRAIQVLNRKWACCNLCFIEHASLLGNRHFGVSFCHTSDFRRITTQIRRQHIVIGDHACTHKAEAIEQI